jgi:hypothetical protein
MYVWCNERVKLHFRNVFDTCDVFQVKLIVVLPKLNEIATSSLYFFNSSTDFSNISVYVYYVKFLEKLAFNILAVPRLLLREDN